MRGNKKEKGGNMVRKKERKEGRMSVARRGDGEETRKGQGG